MPVISYTVVKPIPGKLEEGEVIQLDDVEAKPLVDAGILQEAEASDLEGGETDETADAPEPVLASIESIVDKISQKAHAAVLDSAEKVVKGKLGGKQPDRPSFANRIAAETTDDGKFGFKNLGEYALCIVARDNNGDMSAARKLETVRKGIAKRKGQMDTGGGPTMSFTDQGALIPPSFSKELFSKVKNVTNMVDECRDEPFSGNFLQIPAVNENAPSQGILSYWTTEAAAITDSTLPVNTVQLTLNSLCTLVNLTNQLIRFNAYSIDSYLKDYVPKKMIYELNKHVLYGTGNGANVIGNAATISVTRQTASRISFQDVSKMYSQMSDWNLDGAKWYISPSIITELLKLAYPDTTGTAPLFLGGGTGGYPDVTRNVAGYLYGKPIVLCSSLQALGATGDILFADMEAVSCIRDVVDGEMSMHLYFDKNISTLRFIYYVDTASRWGSAYTRPDLVTMSPFVKLSGSSVVVPT